MRPVVIESAIRAVLIAAGTAGVLRILDIRTAAARHAAWAAVMLAMLLLPLWTAWGPRIAVRLLAPLPEGTTVQTHAADVLEPVIPSSVPLPRYAGWNWATCLSAIYLAGFSVLLVRLMAGTVQAHLLVRRACLRDGRLCSRACIAPVTVGWIRPVVILPESCSQWPQAQLDAVLAHEQAHARRHDPLVQWLALFNRAVFWFHPLAWWLERRLAVLAEEVCDAVVLARGHDARDYSKYLLAMARSVASTGSRIRLWGMAMPGGFLEARIRRILTGGPLPPLSRARLVVASFGCAAVSTMFAAGTVAHRPAARLYAALAQRPAPAKTPAFVAVSDAPGVKVTGAHGVLHRAAVEYPAEAREKGVEGTITIDVVLAPDGTLSDAAVIGGPLELRRAALSSVLQWQFSKDAAPRQQVAIEFKLPEATPPAAPQVQVQELAEPRLLERILVQRLSETAAQDLRARLPLQPGQMLDNEGLQRIRQAAHEFDESLAVSVARTVTQDGRNGAFVMIFPRSGVNVRPEHAPAGGDVPRRLHVDIQGLSPEATSELHRRLAVREGEILDYPAFVKEIERIHRIVREFDPHLSDSRMVGKVPRKLGPDGKMLPPDIIDSTLIISPRDSASQPAALQQYAKFQKPPPNPLENVPIKLRLDIQGLPPEAAAELRRRLAVQDGETTDSEALKKTMARIREVTKDFDSSLTDEVRFDFPPRQFGPDGQPIPWASVDATIVIQRSAP